MPVAGHIATANIISEFPKANFTKSTTNNAKKPTQKERFQDEASVDEKNLFSRDKKLANCGTFLMTCDQTSSNISAELLNPETLTPRNRLQKPV